MFAMSLCASVYMCFVVTCWERADLLALIGGVCCEFVTFPLVSWVRCGTWLYLFLIFAPLLTFILRLKIKGNEGQWLAACGRVSASSQSLHFILSLRMYSNFITSKPGHMNKMAGKYTLKQYSPLETESQWPWSVMYSVWDVGPTKCPRLTKTYFH